MASDMHLPLSIREAKSLQHVLQFWFDKYEDDEYSPMKDDIEVLLGKLDILFFNLQTEEMQHGKESGTGADVQEGDKGNESV